MNAWLIFWVAVSAASGLLFFGVALVVAIRGWKDVRDLYRRLGSVEQASGTDDQK